MKDGTGQMNILTWNIHWASGSTSDKLSEVCGALWLFPQTRQDHCHCPSYFSIAVIRNHGQKQLGKGSIYSSLQSVVCHSGKPGNWCGGHGRVPLTGLFLMACSACFPLPSRDQLPNNVLPIVNWASQINHQSRKHAQANLVGVLSVKAPFSRACGWLS